MYLEWYSSSLDKPLILSLITFSIALFTYIFIYLKYKKCNFTIRATVLKDTDDLNFRPEISYDVNGETFYAKYAFMNQDIIYHKGDTITIKCNPRKPNIFIPENANNMLSLVIILTLASIILLILNFI